MNGDTLRARADVPQALTWDLSDLFPDVAAWETEMANIEADLPRVTQFQGRIHHSAQTLAACLEAEEALRVRVLRATTYTSLIDSADGSDPVNQAHASRASALSARVQEATSFIRTEVLDLPEQTLANWLTSEPSLEPWQVHLGNMLRDLPYRLSAETERVLAALSEALEGPYAIYSRSRSADVRFDPVVDASGRTWPVSFALYEDQFEQNPDTQLRRQGYASFVKGLRAYQNTFAATYATEVQRQLALSRQRGYDSVTHMLLHGQQVTEEMYTNLLDVIGTELAGHMRRLAKLRKRALGLDELYVCDLKVPLDPGFNPATDYEAASKTILAALGVMGDEYCEIIRRGLTERWVDRADNQGKRSGAFCSSPYGVHPYILLTWTDNMRSTFVLAHELGHACHFTLAGRHQRYANVRPSRYFVEAPSTFNERLLAQYLMRTSDDPRMRRWVVAQSLGTYYHNFVTHLLEARLQRRVYEQAEAGTPITAKALCDWKAEVLSEFWGDTVVMDEGASLTWMRQPHYYMGLYPYTYSAGLTASTLVAQMVEDEGQPAVDRWLAVLQSGGTKTPLELMKMAGVDMSSPDPIRKVVAYVGSLVDELEASEEG